MTIFYENFIFEKKILIFDEKLHLIESNDLEHEIGVLLIKSYSIFTFLLMKLKYFDVYECRFHEYYLLKVYVFKN